MMKKCFLVLVSFVFFMCMLLSFVVVAETTEPESFLYDESTSLAVETSSEPEFVEVSEPASEEFSELSSVSSSDQEEIIINRLDHIYTLGLFFVACLAALLVIFILWHVISVFI